MSDAHRPPPLPPLPPLPRLRARYRLQAADAASAAEAAQALALEQSIEAPLDAVFDEHVRAHIVARVESVRETGPGVHEAEVSLATETTGLDAAQTLNMLFGNSSLHDTVQLLDAEFPEAFHKRFGGPRHGIAGLRTLTGAHRRSLTCTALKPQGVPSAELARLCHVFASAGIDIVKDDHGLANQDYSPFAERVAACQRAVERAMRETGKRTLYAPSLVGTPKQLLERARILREEGVGAALVAPMLVGAGAFQELVAEHLQVPVLAHPAYAGAARVAPEFLLGKFFRLLGADAVIFPHAGGRFSYSEARCHALADAARGPLGALRPALPVPAGGMHAGRVPELVSFYGNDVMLLIGGSLLRAGAQLGERTREFVQAVARAAQGADANEGAAS